MKKIDTQQRGFATVLVAVVLILLVGLGCAGWFVWQRNKKGTTSSYSASTNTQTINNQSNQTTPPDPTEDGKYLVIKEWGVRFLLPQALRGDVEYGIFNATNGDQYAYFASRKVSRLHGPNTCGLEEMNDSSGSGVFGGLISLSRSATKPEDVYQRSFQRADYWFTITPSNGGACFEGDTGQESGAFKGLMDSAMRELVPLQ